MEILEIKMTITKVKKRKLNGWIWFHVQNVMSFEVITPIIKPGKNKLIKSKSNEFSWTH